MRFEYYTLNFDFNKQKVERYNIFNNIHVQNWTEKVIKKYLRSPKNFKVTTYDGTELEGFDALCYEIRGIIKNQCWSRREYEISVNDAFVPDIHDVKRDLDRFINEGHTDINEFKDTVDKTAKRYVPNEKHDVYYQCELNIPMIARECIYQYRKTIKENENGNIKE